MAVWRMSLIVEMDAENIDQAESIGREVWVRSSAASGDIRGYRWIIPVGEFRERDQAPEHPVEATP